MSRTETRPIGPVDLAAERAFLGEALDEAVQRVLASGRYVLGPEVERFERDFARACRVSHGIGVASGTDALILALLALGVRPGDRVLTSPFTFFASAGTIAWIGATPALADVDPETALLDPATAGAAIDARTTCIVPVHLFGQMADVSAFRRLADEHGLALLEDGAQAHGANRDGVAPGELGDACTFSFYPTKNLGAAGEGGMVVTKRDDVAQALRLLRDHGSPSKYRHDVAGTNSRLHTLQAAILGAKLPHLATWNRRRRELAARYDEGLRDVAGLRPLARAPGAEHVFHQYTVRIDGEIPRDAVLAGLGQAGIGAGVHYPTPVHLQEAARAWGYGPGDFPAAEALSREVLSLPVHPFLADADIDRVIAVLRGLLGA